MKKIIITGITNGIGEKIFVEFSKYYKVIGISKNIKTNYKDVNKIKIACDLSDLYKVSRLKIRNIISSKDEIYFINNAASILPIKKNGKFRLNEITDIFNVNAMSPIILIQKILQATEIKSLTILNITTGAAKNPLPGWSLYCSTKAASEIYFNTLKLEYPNLQLFNYNPGIVDTNMQKKIRNSSVQDFPDLNKFLEYKEKFKLKTVNDTFKEIKKILKI